jgi:hypothetical protein
VLITWYNRFKTTTPEFIAAERNKFAANEEICGASTDSAPCYSPTRDAERNVLLKRE